VNGSGVVGGIGVGDSGGGNEREDWSDGETAGQDKGREGRRRRGRKVASEQRAETDTQARTPYQRQGIGLGLGLDSERLLTRSKWQLPPRRGPGKETQIPSSEANKNTAQNKHCHVHAAHVHFTLNLPLIYSQLPCSIHYTSSQPARQSSSQYHTSMYMYSIPPTFSHLLLTANKTTLPRRHQCARPLQSYLN
jgi:hypothetical protein